MADRVRPRVARRILGPQAQQLAAQPLRRVLTGAIGVEIGMRADDRVHHADDFIRRLVRARRIAERDRQRLEETKPAIAVAQIAAEDSAPAEFGAGDMRAALALYAGRQRGAKLVPVDRRSRADAGPAGRRRAGTAAPDRRDRTAMAGRSGTAGRAMRALDREEGRSPLRRPASGRSRPAASAGRARRRRATNRGHP